MTYWVRPQAQPAHFLPTRAAFAELIRDMTRDAGGVATAGIWATGVRALKAELHRHNHEAAEQRQRRAMMVQRIRALLDQVKDGLPANPTWPFTWNIELGYFPGAYKLGLASNSSFRIPQSDAEAFIERRKRQEKAATSEE